MSRKFVFAASSALAAVTIMAAACPAVAQQDRGARCEELWTGRNQIYKDNGYCFKTRRAIETFGNQGCNMRTFRLSARDQREVARIQREESAYRCSE